MAGEPRTVEERLSEEAIGAEDLIIFTAAMTGSGNLKFDDAGGKVVLSFPESEKNEAKRLIDCRHKELIVIVGVKRKGSVTKLEAQHD